MVVTTPKLPEYFDGMIAPLAKLEKLAMKIGHRQERLTPECT